MPGLWEKTSNAKDSTDLKRVELSELAINEPTVIIMSGWPANDGAPDALSKEIHFMRNVLARRPEIKSMPKVYCWSHKSGLSAIFNVIPYNLRPNSHYSRTSRNLAQALIMPLVSENNQPLPTEEAQRRLRNLTLYNVCAGSIVGQEVYNASLKMMKEIGYTPEAAKELLHEVADIAVAPMTAPWKEKNRFATLTLINSDDMVVRFKDRFLHPLHRIFFRASRRLRINPLSNYSVLVTSAARREMLDWRRKKEIIEGVRLSRWRLLLEKKGGFPINFNHEIPDYLNYDDKRSQVSRIVPYALANAINRTSANPMQFLEPPQDAPDFYRRKISNALVI